MEERRLCSLLLSIPLSSRFRAKKKLDSKTTVVVGAWNNGEIVHKMGVQRPLQIALVAAQLVLLRK
jgi:hypothetical protein